MNSDEWYAQTDIALMLQFARPCISDRKLRLFAVECCRCVWDFLPEHARKAVDVAELYSDDLASREELRLAEQAVLQDGISAANWDAAMSCGSYVSAESAWIAAEGVSRCAQIAGWQAESPTQIDEYVNYKEGKGGMSSFDDWRCGRRREQASILRDIINPLLTHVKDQFPPAVVRIARVIYDENRYDLMPIMADALEESGCRDSVFLSHCRDGVRHVKGCWVVDNVVGMN